MLAKLLILLAGGVETLLTLPFLPTVVAFVALL